MLSYVHRKTKPKGHKETLRNVGYVYYFACVDGIKGVCVYSSSSNCTY